MPTQYRLRYLPLFWDDLEQAVLEEGTMRIASSAPEHADELRVVCGDGAGLTLCMRLD